MWTDTESGLLNAILDQLIPPNPSKNIPGAGELGVAGYLNDQAMHDIRVRTSIETLLLRAAQLADEVSPSFVRQLETELPGSFAVLLSETYKGYYSRPDMREKVGVGAHPVHPQGYAVAPEPAGLIDDLTAPVRARGPVYRDPTGGTA